MCNYQYLKNKIKKTKQKRPYRDASGKYVTVNSCKSD